jgi:hypothetical protein
VYYNVTELGLGREIACNTNANGTGCFVTNYGDNFNSKYVAQLDAKYGGPSRPVKNTVVISYQPSLPADHQVNFAAYGPEGERINYAQLDYMGKRPLPGVCTRCHGGSYDSSTGRVQNARFLPLNPELIEFADDGQLYDRQSQESAIKSINDVMYNLTKNPPSAPLLTTRQVQYLERIYEPFHTSIGTFLQFRTDPNNPNVRLTRAATELAAPPNWANAGTNKGELYRKTVLRFCDTCHMAFGTGPAYQSMDAWSTFSSSGGKALFGSYMGFDGTKWMTRDLFQMPQAQPALSRFWGDPTTIGIVQFPSAAQALFSALGLPFPSLPSSLGCQTNADCGQRTVTGVPSSGINGGRICDGSPGGSRKCLDGCQRTPGPEFTQCPGADKPITTMGHKEWCGFIDTNGRGSCSRCGGLGETVCNDLEYHPPFTGPGCDETVNPGCSGARPDCRIGGNSNGTCGYIDYSAGQNADQSSTYFNAYPATRATDSNWSGDWNAEGSTLNHTAGQPQDYWYVTLGGTHPIRYVNITNRTDCCWDRLSDYKVYGFFPDVNGTFNPIIGSNGYWDTIADLSGVTSTDSGVHYVAVNANIAGVMIRLNGTNFLHMGNVSVLGL